MTSSLGPESEFREYDKKRKWNEIYSIMRIKSMDNDHSLNDCKLPQFRSRNRYRDVYPYDHSRVRLERDGIDYINANLVEAPRANRKYILTQGPVSDTCGHLWLMVWEQRSAAVVMLNRCMEGLRGPLQETCGHFWLMVWEQKTKAVLMLNKIIEKGTMKCHRYYPMGAVNGAEDELTFPDVSLRVEYMDEDDCDYYTIRKLLLHDLRTGESRQVLQFHYTAWPDFDVPSSPATFLDFLQSVRQSGALSQNVGPPVIHCSAGIGRSGTFCLVDTCLVQIEEAQEVESLRVLDVLLDMRQYRMGLIQTADQLRFSYLAILEGARRLLPHLATLHAAYQSNMSNSNGLADWPPGADDSEDDDSDIPSEPPPPPPRPETTRVRPRSANPAKRTPPGGYPADARPEVRARSTAETSNFREEEEEQVISSEAQHEAEDRDKLLQRGVEIRRRKREERQKNTQQQLERMRAKQQANEIGKTRRNKLKPYFVGLTVVLVIGGIWIYKHYYT